MSFQSELLCIHLNESEKTKWTFTVVLINTKEMRGVGRIGGGGFEVKWEVTDDWLKEAQLTCKLSKNLRRYFTQKGLNLPVLMSSLTGGKQLTTKNIAFPFHRKFSFGKDRDLTFRKGNKNLFFILFWF